MIYVIGADALPDRVKIGWSKKPQKRLAHLQVGSPVVLTLIAAFDADQGEEKALHEVLATKRLHGEWFNVSPAEAVDLLTAAGVL